MSFPESLVGSKTKCGYEQLHQDTAEDEIVITEADTDNHPKHSHLKLSLLANLMLLLLTLVLASCIIFQQYQSAKATYFNGTQDLEQVELQRGVAEKVIKTYHFYEPNLDDEDFEIGDPYWAALFPEGAGQVFLSDDTVQAYRLPEAFKVPQRGNFSV
ncbi:hypothetical protein AB5N19_03875 [Seiridium cardinale]